ncbi:Mitochondrial import receptor subunit TOM70 [Nymphon striatum]|nr:Mitochondrial import receptor subunit TOM70 [Nymphon striatum]
MPRFSGLTKWQYALLIGTPIAIGAGYLYYRNISSSNKKREKPTVPGEPTNEESSKVKPPSELEVAMTCKNKGNSFFKEGKYSDAIVCYSESILLCPGENKTQLATFYQNRAAAYEQLKNFNKVVEDTSKALELNTKYFKALNRRAKAYESLKQYEKCLEDVTAICIIEAFQNRPALLMTDRVLKVLGQEKAKEAIQNHIPYLPSKFFITHYFRSYHNDPLTADANKYEEGMTGYLKAIHDFASEKYGNVIKDCDEEINKNGDHKAEAMLLRSTFYTLQGQTDAAKKDFNTLISDPNVVKQIKANALIKLASLKMQEEQADECFEDFKESIRLYPENPDVYLHRGQIYLLVRKLQESVEDMNKAVELAPDFQIAHVQLCYMKYRRAVDNNNSVELTVILNQFESLQAKFPNCTEAFFLHAQVLTEQEKYEAAFKMYDYALKIDNGNPNIHVHKGILILQWRQDINEAVELINLGIKTDPTCDFAYETLGSIEVQRGNLEKAVSLFDESIKLAKTEPELVHLFALREAAAVQQKVSKNLGINIPLLG